MGVAEQFLGDQISARHHLEEVLTHRAAADHRPAVIRAQQSDLHVIRFHTDLQISARVYLARVLWLQGFSDQAMRTPK